MAPANGSVVITANETRYSETARYSCDVGYEITVGDWNRTCGDDGDWSGVQPVCTIKGKYVNMLCPLS